MDLLEQALEMVRPLLPPPGTVFSGYTFLTPDTLWTGTYDGPFVAVAEDRWPNGGGSFLMVQAGGPVYLAGLEDNVPFSYCAASFSKFMQNMGLCMIVYEDTPSPSASDQEGLAKCEAAEQFLREQAMTIDPTAIEDEESFWSTAFEELGYGM